MRPPARITLEQFHDRRWELLALTSVGAFMTPLDSSIIAVALSAMSPDLSLSFGQSMWVQAAYLLAMAVLLIPLGRLADQHGRLRFYLIGVVVFTLGSVLAAASLNGTWLIGSRVIQGGGAALLSATSAAIVTAVFPPSERGRALGLNVMAVYIGLSIGPPLGGFLVDNVGWRWIFLINLPIGIVLFVWGLLLLPRTETENRAAPRPDILGAALLGVFLVCLLVPLTFAPEWGWAAAHTVGLLALAVLSLVAFVIVELRVTDPVLDLDLLLHNRLFAAANTAALLNYMALFAISMLTAIYLEVVQGRSAAITGWLMLGQPVMQAVLSPLAGRLSDRIGSRVLATSGMLLTGAGMVLLGAMPASAGMPRVIFSLAVVGVGLAAFSAPNTSAIMGSVARHQLGLASAFLATMRVVGMALSVAVLGGIAASQLGRLGGRLLFSHGQDAGALAGKAVSDYADGYSLAMYTGAALALLGAAVSLTRGARGEEAAPKPGPAAVPRSAGG
ncbi:MAG: DHA2 family efflux MFS transporter permease subunit [Methanobacteriota archaeon]|nr:MAG: DHA2 family efflux MFS transporter permease subunit [Euryarchaeota archaeon]